MAGRGKLCLAYSNDPTLYPERVARSHMVTKAAGGHLIDNDGLTVEDFGLPDNLMMIHTIDLRGARLVMPRQRPVNIWHDLASFEACVALAADRAPTVRADSKADRP
jgi:nucleoside 2-deoxyribosyltransferase